MTPDECMVGTIVEWGERAGVISSPPFTADTPATKVEWGTEPYVRVTTDDGFGAVLCSALSPAKRFLVAGQWQSERGEPLQAAIDWMHNAWMWSIPVRPGVHHSSHSPSFHAAQRAVEAAL